MDQAPVVEVIVDGQKLIDALVRNGIEVTTAFWAMAGDDEQWFLYLVSPLLLTENETSVYRRMHPVIRQLQAQPFWVDPFAIKLLGPQSPMAEAAEKLRAKYPGMTQTGGTQLGGVPVKGAIIYPVAVPGVVA